MGTSLQIKDDGSGNFTTAIANITPETGNLSANKDRLLSALDTFSKEEATFCLFPEYTLSGTFWNDTAACHAHMQRANLATLLPWLESRIKPYITETLTHIVINGPLPDSKGSFFNTTLIIDRSGISLGPDRTYRKTFLPGSEKNFIRSGRNDKLIMDTPYGRMGFLTCYDLCFPPLLTHLVFDHNIDVLVVPAAWRRQGERTFPELGIHEPNFYQLQWEMMLPALATQYQIWIFAANAVGPHAKPNTDYCGRSGIWTPSGLNTMLASDRKEELLLLKKTDLRSALEIERTNFGVLKDFKDHTNQR